MFTLHVKDRVHGSLRLVRPVNSSICSVITPQCLSGSYIFDRALNLFLIKNECKFLNWN